MKKPMNFRLPLFLIFFLHLPAFASRLPHHMNQSDLSQLTSVIAGPLSQKVFRAADAYSLMPGIKIGMEAVSFSTHKVNALGDGNGTLPSQILTPRLYFAKGLPLSSDLVINFLFPGVLTQSYQFSATLKTSILSEQDSFAHLAGYVSYNTGTLFDNLATTSLEVGAMVSRDLVGLNPYLGLGIQRIEGKLGPTADQVPLVDQKVQLHAFIGAELEYGPSFSLQLDLVGAYPSIGFLAAYRL